MPKDKEIPVIRMAGNKTKESANCDDNYFQVGNNSECQKQVLTKLW